MKIDKNSENYTNIDTCNSRQPLRLPFPFTPTFSFITCFCSNFMFFHTGELESIASDKQNAQKKPQTSGAKKDSIDFYPYSGVVYTGSQGCTRVHTVQSRDTVKDSGIDTCLSSSCQTLSEEILKSKV